jgi:hypothetical protein
VLAIVVTGGVVVVGKGFYFFLPFFFGFVSFFSLGGDVVTIFLRNLMSFLLVVSLASIRLWAWCGVIFR